MTIKIHNIKYYVLAGIIIFLILITGVIICIIIPRGKPVEILNSDMLFSVVQDGDIICRLGDRFWSQLFKDVSVTDRRFSHMGIVRVMDSKIIVIHAEGDTGHGRDFVNEIGFDEFLKIARAVGIYRIKETDGSIISNLAVNYLGIPFDWQFDMYDETKLYCTELLSVILKQAHADFELDTIYVKELGKNIIPLDAISNSQHFTEIYFISSADR